MTEERIRMRLGIIKTEEEKALITLKKKSIQPFIATVGEFNYQEEHNKVDLHRNSSTKNFPVVGDIFTTEVRNISEVVIFEE